MLKARPKPAQPLTAVLKPTDLAPGLSREAGSCMGAEPTDCVWPKLAESGPAALESPAATSRRWFLKTVDGN
jgi:hypothetical protein